MGLLAPTLAMSGIGRALDDRYYPGGGGTAGGWPSSVDEPMTIAAFYAAVAYVSEDEAKLPLSMYEDLGDDAAGHGRGRRAAKEHPLQELLHDQPNRRQTSLEWREMANAISMLRGYAVNEQIAGAPVSYPGRPTRSGTITAIVPLHPDLVERRVVQGGNVVYDYRDPRKGFQVRTLLEDEVLINRWRQSQSVLAFATRSLNTILAQERFSSFMFQRGAKHQGVIQAKGRLSDPTRKALRRALNEYSIDGPRAGRPLLLEDGMEWKQVSMTMEDAEALGQQQWSVAQVCRWIRIPPHKVFDLTRSTNNNIEAQGIDYVTDSILGVALRWEQAIYRDLIAPADHGRFFAKHNLNVLMRGDAEARGKFYSLGIQWGFLTRNEVRALEEMNPIDGLDEPLTPSNMLIGADGSTKVDYPPQIEGGHDLPRLTAGDDSSMFRLLASDAASRSVRREIAAMSKLADKTATDPAAWRVAVTAAYGDEFVARLASDLHIPEPDARRYAAEQRSSLVEAGPAVMADWLTDRVDHLTERVMERPEVQEAAA